jgi:FMN phosphatase YigB (HAD superfamily)
LTKPDPRIYEKAAELMGLKVEECIMVAAHAYDTRAAKDVGMQTVYIHRTTEDVGEDFVSIQQEFDLFIDGRDGSTECGIGALAKVLLEA